MAERRREVGIDGPDQYFSAELDPSRGQMRTIALISLDLLGIEIPTSRLDASVAIARLQAAREAKKKGEPPELRRPW